MIAHIVFFRLKDRSEGSVKKAYDSLLGLKNKVPVIRRLEAGIDVLKLPRSYDVALTVHLDSLADLEAYRVHPEHVVVADYLKGVSESIVSVDYEVK